MSVRSKRRRPALRLLRHALANDGWRALPAKGWRWARRTAWGWLRSAPAGRAAEAVHPFDALYGTDTHGVVWGHELDVTSDAAAWATAYYGIAPSIFSAALERLGLRWQDFTFVDLGCGKGRALMLAARMPFRRTIGVELSPALVRTAQANLGRFAAKGLLATAPSLVCADAAEFHLPAGPLVLSCFNPFAAPVMRRFLRQLEESLAREPREVWLLYFFPLLDPLVRSCTALETVWDQELTLSDEDHGADHFGARALRVIAYRSRRTT